MATVILVIVPTVFIVPVSRMVIYYYASVMMYPMNDILTILMNNFECVLLVIIFLLFGIPMLYAMQGDD